MAKIVNARDVILQAVSPRVATTTVATNLIVDPSQVTGLGLVIAGTKMVFLTATTQVFQIAKSGTVSPTSTLLTASLKNLTATPTLTVISGTITPTPALVDGKVTVAYGSMSTDTATIRLAVVQDGVTYTDEITLVKVREGIDGLVGFITNESHSLPADYLGNVTNYAGAGGGFKVFQGINDITGLCSFSIPAGGNTSGLTASINATTGVYVVTGAYPTNVDSVTLTLRATFGSAVLEKIFTVQKSKAGVPAKTLTLTSTSQVFQITKAGVVSPASVVFTSLQNSLAGTPVFSVMGTGASISFTPGSSQCTLTYANMASNESVVVKVTQDGYEDTITVVKLREGTDGSAGADAIVGLLSNEASVVAADNAGTVASFANSGGTFKVFQGIVDKTGLAAYSVVSSSNITISIAATGVYTVSSLSQDFGTALLRAVFGGVTVDKVYSIAKARTGTAGTAGTNGTNGTSGTNGIRGSRTFYVSLTGATNTYSNTLAATTASVEGGPVVNDLVTQYNSSVGFSESRFYQSNGTWGVVNAVVDGNLLVSGTVGATHIQTNTFSADNAVTRGLTVRDINGKILLSSGVNLDYLNVGGTKPPSNATFGADWGTNVTGAAAVNSTINNSVARLTTRTNLAYNGGFENGFAGWIGNTGSLSISDGVWGRAAVGSGISGTGVITQNTYFSVQAGETYTVTGDSLLLNASAGAVYFDIEWLTGALAVIGDSAQPVVSALHDFSAGETNRLAHASNAQAPANAAYGRVRFVWEAIAGSAIVGCRQIKVERGVLPATPYTADATLPVLQSAANNARAIADASALAITSISSDNVLSKGEKSAAIAEYTALDNDYAGITSQANTLGVSFTAYNAQLTALQTYLNSLSPTWSDTSSDTPIVGTTFRQKFLDVHAARQQLLNGIAAKAATLATWSSVTGAGRPADNATVGATFGSNISGKITAQSASTFIDAAAINNAQIGTLDATKINTGFLSADRISAGSVTADKLNIGSGRNLLVNSTWVERIGGTAYDRGTPRSWTAATNQPSSQVLITPENFPDWCPVGMFGLDLNQDSSFVADSVLLINTLVPVVVGNRYEFSVYSGSHRANVYTQTEWLDVAGNVLSTVADFRISNDEVSVGGRSLSAFRQIGHFGYAPANAVQARFYIIKGTTKNIAGYTNSHAFLVAPMVAEASANQTIFSTYSPSGLGTKITGAGIETNSITADNIAVGTITAGSGIIANLAVNTLQIAGNAVTIPSSKTGSSYGTELNVSLVAGQPVYISCLADGGGVRYDSEIPRYAYLAINGGRVRTVTSTCAFFNTARYDVQVSLIYNYVPTYDGNHTFTFNASGNEYTAHVFVIQTKR